MEGKSLKIFCNGSIAKATESRGIKWLIGAPFMPLTILSSLNCVHTVDEDPFRPNYESEAEELHWLLPKGLEVVGALLVSVEKVIDDTEKVGKVAMEMRKYFSSNDNHAVAAITAVNDKDCIEYFMYIAGASHSIKGFDNIAYEEQPSEHLWDSGCLIHCNVSLKLPLYLSSSRSLEEQLSLLHSDFLRDIEGSETVFQAEYVVGPSEKCSPVLLSLIEKEDKHSYVILNYKDHSDTNISCLKLCSSPPNMLKTSGFEIPKPIHISVLLQTSHGSLKGHAPTINYFPANEDVRQMILSIKLDILCISSKESSLTHSISNLVIPGLSSQFCAMRKFLSPGVKRQKLNAYHFCPTGFLHPVTAVYDLCLGEMELNQVRLREKLHARLHLPLDRPMLRIANALNVHVPDSLMENSNGRKGKNRLTDVHIGLSSSGVVDGQTSLIEGTYEYYHYLQDDFDDSGWGCAYRSLQTIISWFRYQHYTPIDVPSHRKIQETLVDIGDKEPSFIGSREWIGAIELSFVLDKLLGVSCKILNVRSGAELLEKCRELALHFATQGTPVMIGGGVLAYTLLGVDYNSLTGDCAFLILDPHYTGVDDLKSIQNGGWCGWKKAVSSKGKEFFLRDKFYNLLLPQRPNMV